MSTQIIVEVDDGVVSASNAGLEEVNSNAGVEEVGTLIKKMIRDKQGRRGKIETSPIHFLIIAMLVIWLVVACAGNLTWLDLAFGFGLEVEPVEINIENVPLGKKIALSDLGGDKMKLRIQNKGAADYIYAINVLFSTEAQDSHREGYIDIPDKSWLIPENKELCIPANSSKVVELYLKIPKRKAYYDKKYQAVIEVKSKKNRPEDIFVLAVQLRMCFSTRRELPLIKENANLR